MTEAAAMAGVWDVWRSSRVVRRFRRNKAAVAGLIVYLTAGMLALAAPILAPYHPEAQNLEHHHQGPSLRHWMGCDGLGRDVLSRVLYGGRISLRIGIIVVTVSLLVGVTIGSLAGYAGGWVDEAVMRVTDVLLAFPGILLAIAIVSVLGPGINQVIVALCLTGWVGYARLSRGQVLQARELEFVKAARALGAGAPRILFHHILPTLVGPIVVQATLGMAAAVLAEGSLSFLGLGVRPPIPSWGAMLLEGVDAMDRAPHLTVFPGLAIASVVAGLNFLGDGLREAVDPKQ